MRIKTFYSKTMTEALREIKDSLGPEALLLSTKEIPRRSGAWGRSSGFEVVAACEHSEDIDVFSPSRKLLPGVEQNSRLEQESMETATHERMPEIYSPSTMIKKSSTTSSAKNAKPKKASEHTEEDLHLTAIPDKELPLKGRVPVALYQDMVDCGVDAALARELLLNAWESLTTGQRRSRPALMRSLAHATLSLVADPLTKNGMPEKKIVAFVGPTGVGKTTSIAKLAAHLALQKKKKVVLVTLDGYRIGAIEQLRSYAGLMGIPFCFADQVSELTRVIEENKQRDYILIDTAGRGPRDIEAMLPLADYLKQSGQIERHLVLSATTKPSDLRKMMDLFEICCPDHLLFTKLDETSKPGPILNELVRTQKHFSYYSDGQRVPDDLHAVPKDGIIDIVLNRNENALKD